MPQCVVDRNADTALLGGVIQYRLWNCVSGFFEQDRLQADLDAIGRPGFDQTEAVGARICTQPRSALTVFNRCSSRSLYFGQVERCGEAKCGARQRQAADRLRALSVRRSGVVRFETRTIDALVDADAYKSVLARGMNPLDLHVEEEPGAVGVLGDVAGGPESFVHRRSTL